MLVRCGDSQGFHFAVEVAALEPKGCGGLCHIPAVFLQLAKNKLAFISAAGFVKRSEEHTSELQSQSNLVCRLLLEKKKTTETRHTCSHCAPHYTMCSL